MTHHALERDLSPDRLRHIRWLGGGSGAGEVNGSATVEKVVERAARCLGLSSASGSRPQQQ